MNQPEEKGLWAIVLAAGRGTRLQGITTVGGEAVPKQFCALRGDVSMLRRALQRAAMLVPEPRIQVVVAAEQRKWWERELEDLAPASVVEQPRDRGTANGVLLPLTAIHRQDPEGMVVLLPADHHVGREWILQAALGQAVAAVHAHPEKVVLLGMTPEETDPEFGWIVPRRNDLPTEPAAVERFREKPDAEEASALIAQGALVNSFVLAARVGTLLSLFERHLPELPALFRRWRGDAAGLRRLYEHLPTFDFSREILEPSVDRLAVVSVPPCGWSDLGTPARVARCLETDRKEPAPVLLPARHGFVPPVDLSRRLAGVQRGA
ncbi:MAG TPA: sugar phosphate nucleotidyltransferase [Thermoanaerobaculia bacterium]|nr:sugar phosphate nucleotidyltransferase [Thermoanaerobaculia bacterium]